MLFFLVLNDIRMYLQASRLICIAFLPNIFSVIHSGFSVVLRLSFSRSRFTLIVVTNKKLNECILLK